MSYTEAMKLNRPYAFWDEELVDTERQERRHHYADTYYYPGQDKFWNDFDNNRFLAAAP